MSEVVAHAKRYPMMAQHQVVIIKEVQALARQFDQLEAYAENPQPSTVLVLCYKHKKFDARKKVLKLIRKNGVVFESKPLYDNQVPDWIRSRLATKGYTISPKAAQMLVEFLGNDLAKVNNELEKLQLLIPSGTQISPAHIEENIGISKDYNNFELQRAISSGDKRKAFGIVQYFGQNPSSHPILMTTSLLYSFFTRLLKYHALMDKTRAASALGIQPYFVKEYKEAARNFPMKKVSRVITHIRDVDMKSKGVGAANLPQAELYKELLIGIFS
jgi:DNA polymerase-3 subunit delta